MYCPICSHKDTKVVDSRLTVDGANIRRRRECCKCGYRFSTVEEIEILDLAVVKRDGRRESYSRDKIVRGLLRSLEKRPYTSEAFQGLLHAIERDIQKRRKHEITSAEIGAIVSNRLKNFDKIAYLRFASVYRAFEDIEAFQNELRGLLRPPGKRVRPRRVRRK